MSTIIQRSLASGEISPALRRRVDLQKFSGAMRTMRNCFVRKGGGASNRGGTTYVYGAPGANAGPPIGATTIAIPWDAPNTPNSYVMEFGNGFIRFTKAGSLLTLSSITAWNGGTAYAIADLVSSGGINYYCIQAHTNHVPPNVTYWYALNGNEYSIPTPYTTGLLLDRGAFNFKQDSDRMLITHGSLLPYELVRTNDTKWTLTKWNVDASSPARYGIPRIAAPTGLAAVTASTQPQILYGVTALTDDLEESLPATVAAPAADNSNIVTLSWSASLFMTGAIGTIKGYKVYKTEQGLLFYLGFASGLSYVDNNLIIPSTNGDSPPETRTELNTTAGTFPRKVGSFDGRTLLGNFSFNIQAGYASRIGFRQNFTRRFPAANDDSILFQLRGKQVSGIQHFVDIGVCIVFADSGEWVLEGDSNSISPNGTFPKQYGYNGASASVWPIVIGSRAVYVQSQGSIVRALGFQLYSVGVSTGRNGFVDEDMTAFAEHLFRGRTLVSMSYQKTPHSILWCVRDDGVLLGLTYIMDQQILAWHHHDTNGVIEDVCCIQEGGEHAVYLIVKRNINGSDVRYMERMTDREFTDIVDAVFLDCSLTYDGRNTGPQTMTLSGGTNWDQNETLTLTSSLSFFSAGDVGNEIWLTGTDGVVYRCQITAYTSATVVSVVPVQTVPVASGLRSIATTTWAKAVNTLSGLNHLNGQKVAIFANGYVVANPNNSDYPIITVSAGSITMPACYSVAHVGLPYISDLETLDIDSQNSETLINKNKLITGLSMDVQDTRGVFAGAKPPKDDSLDPLEGMTEVKIREDEDYGKPNELFNGTMDINIQSEWNSNGRVFIRQVDPLPMTILSIAPAGLIPFRQGGG